MKNKQINLIIFCFLTVNCILFNTQLTYAEVKKSSYIKNIEQQILEMEAELEAQNTTYRKRGKQEQSFLKNTDYATKKYLKKCEKKITVIGNSFIDRNEIKKQNLTGELLIEIVLNPDGSVFSFDIIKSSGNKHLKNIVKQIMQEVSPFEAIPKNVLKNNKRFVFKRSWVFVQ